MSRYLVIALVAAGLLAGCGDEPTQPAESDQGKIAQRSDDEIRAECARVAENMNDDAIEDTCREDRGVAPRSSDELEVQHTQALVQACRWFAGQYASQGKWFVDQQYDACIVGPYATLPTPALKDLIR